MDGTLPGGERPRMGPDADAASPDEPPPRRRRLPFVVLGVVLLVAAAGGGLWWLQARHFETTDDAAIDAHISQVSARVSGRTERILVDDNEHVQQGQLLVQLDPRDWEVKLDQAEAQLATAQAQLAQAQASLSVANAAVAQADANARVAEADLQQAQLDFNRFKSIDPRAVTRQQVDNATSGLRSAQAKYDAARRSADGQRAQAETAQAQIRSAQAGVRSAEVGVEDAKLQLSYTSVVAPQAGRVAKRTVEPGNFVAAGQALLAVVPEDTWVTANFKETQLTDLRPGQPVDIRIDAYPGTLHAKVDSVQSGTGSVFSSIPVENATGNWVKVLQRVPVKIVFDDPRARDLPLAPGLSVTASVRVR